MMHKKRDKLVKLYEDFSSEVYHAYCEYIFVHCPDINAKLPSKQSVLKAIVAQLNPEGNIVLTQIITHKVNSIYQNRHGGE